MSVRDEAKAKEIIWHLLDDKIPILADVDSRYHWVTLVRCNSRHVWIVDSGPEFSEDYIQRWTWRGILRRLSYGLSDETRFRVYPLRDCCP
jgi:hypothetical protein